MRSSFAVACLFAAASAADEADRVQGLPSAQAFDTPTYSGYLDVSETKSLHYTFATSMDNPETDPVIIWFNGGPGCSSMLGFMQENGPRVINDGEDYIQNNPEPWNSRASVIWLESPAGVGYSIAGTPEDLQQNDVTQSEDALAALKQWYGKFPEFKQNKLFVSGESYGGIYVPYLSWQIYENNLQHELNNEIEFINLAGFMVGNGATNWDFDVEPSFPETAANFNVIPMRLLNAFNDNDCYYSFDDVRPIPQSRICNETWAEINVLTAKLNWYDLYRPNIPTTLLQSDRMGSVEINGETKHYKRGMTMEEYTPWAKHILRSQQENDDPIILGDFVTDYMNRADVREALHIPDSAPAWEMCSATLQYHVQDEASYWIYPILAPQYKLMFYSGDTDGAVPTYGTKQWIQELGWEVQDAWRPWYTHGQVSGYLEQYDGLLFATVKGVGHMAPQWARKPMTDLINHFIHDEPM